MRAIGLIPRTPNSLQLVELPQPKVEDIPGGRGVLVKVLRVGLCGTDREIIEGLYGAPPPGSEFLALGHESFGVVETVGPNVPGLEPGDYVVAMVRHPGSSVYDLVGAPDLTTDDAPYERGISLLHGSLTEHYVDDFDYLVKVPRPLEHVAVLLEPTSIVQKGIAHAFDIQRRLPVWRPRRAAVLGAGPIGLLATAFLRLRGIDVATFARTEPPYLNSELVEAVGARYVSTRQTPLKDASERLGPFDLIFEATGNSPLVFEAMQALGRNGVLVLSGISAGDRQASIPSDAINMSFVLGNKVMVGTVNANRQHFEAGIRDLAACETEYSGWLSRLLTHRVDGLDSYREAWKLLGGSTGGAQPIKAFVEVASST